MTISNIVDSSAPKIPVHATKDQAEKGLVRVAKNLGLSEEQLNIASRFFTTRLISEVSDHMRQNEGQKEGHKEGSVMLLMIDDMNGWVQANPQKVFEVTNYAIEKCRKRSLFAA